jgi:hypothetical protein
MGQYRKSTKLKLDNCFNAEIVVPLGHIRSDVRADLGTAP